MSRLNPRPNTWLAIALAVLFLLAENALGQTAAPTQSSPNTAEAHLGRGYDALK